MVNALTQQIRLARETAWLQAGRDVAVEALRQPVSALVGGVVAVKTLQRLQMLTPAEANLFMTGIFTIEGLRSITPAAGSALSDLTTLLTGLGIGAAATGGIAAAAGRSARPTIPALPGPTSPGEITKPALPGEVVKTTTRRVTPRGVISKILTETTAGAAKVRKVTTPKITTPLLTTRAMRNIGRGGLAGLIGGTVAQLLIGPVPETMEEWAKLPWYKKLFTSPKRTARGEEIIQN